MIVHQLHRFVWASALHPTRTLSTGDGVLGIEGRQTTGRRISYSAKRSGVVTSENPFAKGLHACDHGEPRFNKCEVESSLLGTPAKEGGFLIVGGDWPCRRAT